MFGVFMPETSLYMPVLKSKLGEYAALRALMYSSRRVITPLIDILPPATRKEEGGQGRTVSEQMRHHGKQIKQSWTYHEAPICIDTQFMPDSGTALKLLFAHLGNHRVIPVFGPGRSDSYRAAVVDLVKTKPSHGACYRIPKNLLFKLGMDSQLESFITETALTAGSVDIILDLEDVASEYPDESFMAMIGRINSFPQLGDWRSLTLISGSFPVTLAGIQTQTRIIPRHDWLTWRRLIDSGKLQRHPVYGDYGIQNPTPISAPVMGKANIRYTTCDNWVVFRGSETMKRGSETRDYAPQMKPLCKLVSAHSVFSGSDYSAGDQYIYEVANYNAVSSNDPSKWKSVGFSHHLTFVANQLRGGA